jgi:ABC-type thiamine transport system ATPase subunit
MINHLKRLSFCNVRRLNPFESSNENIESEWIQQRTWYELGAVNVFIGANGAGKSTVLELVEIMGNPQRIATLARENQNRHRVTLLQMIFQNSSKVFAKIRPFEVSNLGLASNVGPGANPVNSQALELFVQKGAGAIHSFERNVSKIEIDADSAEDIAAVTQEAHIHVCRFDPSGLPRQEDMVKELNLARAHLGGVLSHSEWMEPMREEAYAHLSEDICEVELDLLRRKKTQPFELLDDGRIGIYLSDDSGQFNHVQTAALPAGWRQLVGIVTWLRSCPEGSICLIEEPETHLHPRLQRYLAQTIGNIAIERELQLLIATHSPVFQQPSAWPSAALVFQARAGVLKKMDHAWRVLDDLGIKGADVSQSNGVIWIEGPSDRLYIKYWLGLYCSGKGIPAPVENRDYAFCTYGGANLSHFSVVEQDAFVDMVCINRNMVIVIDRDNDFALGATDCINKSSAKYRVINEFKSRDLPKSHVWVTDGYTIESYLPRLFQAKYFEVKKNRLVLKKNKNKVDAARKLIKSHAGWRGYCHAEALMRHIETLHRLISSWDI